MTIPTITALPDAPSRSDPANFSTKGDAFVAALPILVAEVNDMVTATNLATADVTTKQELAAASASAAGVSESAAAASAAAAAVTAGAAAWGAGTAYDIGDAVFGSDGHTYRCIVASTNHNPTTDGGAHWIMLTSLKDKTAITGLLKGNGSDISAVVSGTDIKTFNGASLLGSGNITTPASALVLLSSVTANNSATVDLETTFDSTYDVYVIEATSVKPSTDLAKLGVRFKVGGSYVNNSYKHTGVFRDSGNSGTATAAYSTSDGVIKITADTESGSAAGESTDFTARVFAPADSARYPTISSQGAATRGTVVKAFYAAGRGGSAGAASGVRFMFSTGNIASGEFRLYGVAK